MHDGGFLIDELDRVAELTLFRRHQLAHVLDHAAAARHRRHGCLASKASLSAPSHARALPEAARRRGRIVTRRSIRARAGPREWQRRRERIFTRHCTARAGE